VKKTKKTGKQNSKREHKQQNVRLHFFTINYYYYNIMFKYCLKAVHAKAPLIKSATFSPKPAIVAEA